MSATLLPRAPATRASTFRAAYDLLILERESESMISLLSRVWCAIFAIGRLGRTSNWRSQM